MAARARCTFISRNRDEWRGVNMDVSTPRYKTYLPRSFFGRSVMILVVPLTILQVVVALVFIERHWTGVTRQLATEFASEINLVASIVEGETDPLEREALLAKASASLGYEIWIEPEGVLAPGIRRPAYGIIPRVLTETVQEFIDRPVRVDTVALDKRVDLQVALKNGVLHATPRENRMIASKPHLLLVWMVGAAVVLLLIAVIFLRNQVRPIRQLADAAEAFGKGQPAPPFKPSGAEEIRRAAGAFHQMRGRIERQISQRTMMLSGVSHDLRTPLTRMRLALALAEDDPEASALKSDVEEMERMIDGFLAFARGEEGEAPSDTDLHDIVDAIVQAEKSAGHDVSFSVPAQGDFDILLRPDTIRRCVQNLIGNAVKYGKSVRVTLEETRHRVSVTVEDDGPGIPEAEREEAFRPFYRLDKARNLDGGGGSGLGLSIALDAARAHGGDITLGTSDLGGLKAVLTLPR